MDTTTAGRVLIGDSLGFHIIFVLLSIGIPFLMNILEWFAWRNNDDKLRSFVRLLGRWTTVLVVAGVMSGTVIALQFSTLWAPFLDASRPYVGKFFTLEGYAFLVEAVFMSWYFLTIKEVGTLKHWLIGLPITIGAIGSAIFITIVNAWMNNPSNIITSTTFNEIAHSVTAYFFATTLAVLGYVAWRSLKKKDDEFVQKLIGRLAIIGAILVVVIGLLGHQSAVDIANTQPHKLAALELLDKTQTNAPMRIGGSINQSGHAEGGIVIPSILSLLAGYSTEHKVTGLDQFPREKWPLLIIHDLFDIKMALVGLSSALILGAVIFYWRIKKQPRWFAKLLAIFGLSGIIMVELGWMMTELGRQPYAIYGTMLTSEAFTKDAKLIGTGIIFPILFVVLFIAVIFALNATTKAWRKKEELSW